MDELVKKEVDTKYFVGATIDRLIEVERITREGATLKNVSDNIRSLTSFVAVFAVIKVIYTETLWQIQLIAILWGAWAFTYAMLASFQGGLLFISFIGENVLNKYFSKSPSLVKNTLAYIFTLLTIFFMLGAAVVISKSIDLLSRH